MRAYTRTEKFLFTLLLLASALLASCMKDKDEVALNNECYISSFKLESIKQTRSTTTLDGRDSTYAIKIDGSYFPMVIDHRNQTVENRDSLPHNTQTTAILATVTYQGSMLTYRHAHQTADSLWKAYSAKDSIDFSRPLHFKVWSVDGSVSRTYTVGLKVHQQEGDSLYWHCSDTQVAQLQDLVGTKAVCLQGKLVVMGHSHDGVLTSVRHGLGSQAEWTQHRATLPSNAHLATLQKRGDMLYLSTDKGQVYASDNGIDWETCGAPQEGLILAAASAQYLYALMRGSLYRSTDAIEWTLEELDDDISLLPHHSLQSICYTQANGNSRLFLAGANAQGTASQSWSKSWRTDAVEADDMWMYLLPSPDNVYTFPLLQDQTIIPYDGRLLTFGGQRLDQEGASMSRLYESSDNGITWKKDLQLHLPTQLSGTPGPFAAVVDDNHYIWIIAHQQVWRGRLNRLGFEQP